MVKKKKNLDIKTLTEEQKLRKVVINTNTEHFWSSGMSCRDDDNQIIEMVDPNMTTFEVGGIYLHNIIHTHYSFRLKISSLHPKCSAAI